jgi:hypothetical protein
MTVVYAALEEAYYTVPDSWSFSHFLASPTAASGQATHA